MIDDLVVHLLLTRKQCLQGAAIRGIQGPLVDFAVASESDRVYILSERLKETVKSRLGKGDGRFESLLDPLGMGGPVPDSIRRMLMEHSQVRNVLVHKNGIADAKFLEHCPWLGARLGMQIQVSGVRFAAYTATNHWYMLELSRRMDALDGATINARDVELLGKYKNLVDTYCSKAS